MLFKKRKAQSFVEFALVLPILLLVLLGVVELTLFLGTYINLLDLTREAARFASNRDPNAAVLPTARTCTNSANKPLDFFYDTSCIFSPLQDSSFCSANPSNPFCNGFNSTVQLKSDLDDVLIYVFTESNVSGQPKITSNAWCPQGMPPNNSTATSCPWVWSNNDPDTVHNNNWLHKCGTDMTNTTPTRNFYPDLVQSYLTSNTLMDKAFVVVEVTYCYQQVLNIPILSKFLPNPMVIDTYSIMPLPAAQPTLVP